MSRMKNADLSEESRHLSFLKKIFLTVMSIIRQRVRLNNKSNTKKKQKKVHRKE